MDGESNGNGNGGWRDPHPEADTALLAGESRYRRLVEANIIGVVIGDIHGLIKEANDYFLGMIGYTREELAAGLVNWIRLTPPEYLPADEKAVAELIATGVAMPFEKEYIHKDGHRVPVRSTIAMLARFSQDGICLIEDLTDRKRTEAERRQIFEGISDAFVAFDTDWRYIFVNAKAGQLLGRGPESLIGRKLLAVFPDALEKPFRSAFETSMRDQRPMVVEEFYPTLGKWFESRLYPSPEGLSVYFYDVTGRKHSEEKIREQLDELLRWQNATLGREERIQELKGEVNRLLAEMGRPPRYRAPENQ